MPKKIIKEEILPEPPPPSEEKTMKIPEIPPPPPPEFYEKRERYENYLEKIRILNARNRMLHTKIRNLTTIIKERPEKDTRTLTEKIQEKPEEYAERLSEKIREKPPEDIRTITQRIQNVTAEQEQEYEYPYHYSAKVHTKQMGYKTFGVHLPNHYNVKSLVDRHLIFQHILEEYESADDEEFNNEIYHFGFGDIEAVLLIAPGGIREEWRE